MDTLTIGLLVNDVLTVGLIIAVIILFRKVKKLEQKLQDLERK